MPSLIARVRNGRLLLDAPTDLPDGTEVELVPIDGWEDLDEGDRRRLRAAVDEADQDVAQGRVRPAEDVIRDLRREAL